MSKIQSESKSQHDADNADSPVGCKPICQRYNLKANHNEVGKLEPTIDAVNQYVKDTI